MTVAKINAPAQARYSTRRIIISTVLNIAGEQGMQGDPGPNEVTTDTDTNNVLICYRQGGIFSFTRDIKFAGNYFHCLLLIRGS